MENKGWWSKTEIEILEKNVNKNYDELIKLLPKRTLSSIISKKDKLGFQRKSIRYWSEKEDKYLVMNFHRKTINKLSERLGRSQQAIHNRRIRLIKLNYAFKDKKPFLSKYWKEQYKNNKDVILKHKISIGKLWSDKRFRQNHHLGIREKFEDPIFLEKHRIRFLKMRVSAPFKLKQRKVASKMMTERHKNPIEHKKILSNLRKNPSNQQVILINMLKSLYGNKNVGCNDWKILDGTMEVDIPIYSLKTAIEWDGEYWHSKIKGVYERDARKNEELINKGWRVIRILARSTPPLSTKEINNSFSDVLLAIQNDKEFNFLKIGFNSRR